MLSVSPYGGNNKMVGASCLWCLGYASREPGRESDELIARIAVITVLLLSNIYYWLIPLNSVEASPELSS